MSHNIDVLAGRIGTDTRTRRLNQMLNAIDSAVSQVREKQAEKCRISVGYLAKELNINRATVYRNGFPDFFADAFDSAKHKDQKGLIITDVEQFVEERKEQREKLAKINEKNKK